MHISHKLLSKLIYQDQIKMKNLICYNRQEVHLVLCFDIILVFPPAMQCQDPSRARRDRYLNYKAYIRRRILHIQDDLEGI